MPLNATNLKRLPNSELLIYPDAGHGAVFQYHEAFVPKACLPRTVIAEQRLRSGTTKQGLTMGRHKALAHGHLRNTQAGAS